MPREAESGRDIYIIGFKKKEETMSQGMQGMQL